MSEKQIFIPDVRLALDVFFLTAIMLLTERFVKVDLPFYCYRHASTNSITNAGIEQHFRYFLHDLPIMLAFLDLLFKREDALTKLSREERLDVAIRILRQIFNHSISSLDRSFLSSDKASEILDEVLSQPKFHSKNFKREFFKIFGTLLAQV